MRCAQLASISSGPASLSSPSRKKGPSCSRGGGARSSTTGSVDFAIVSASHFLACLDLAIQMIGEVAHNSAVLIAANQPEALLCDPPQFLEFALQIVHDIVYRGPVHLVVR